LKIDLRATSWGLAPCAGLRRRANPKTWVIGYFAVPVSVADCVPAAVPTDTVAVFVPAASLVRGLNCTVTVQLALWASVVNPAWPQVVVNATKLKSAALAPAIAACIMPVTVAAPLLVSVNICAGSNPQASCCPSVVPGQFLV